MKKLICLIFLSITLCLSLTLAACGRGERGEVGPQGEQGVQGPQGEQGEQGPQGDVGEQGVGVYSASVDENGDLIITLTDGTVINAGKAKGEDGAPGQQGPQGEQGPAGEKGEDGAPGKDGQDGKDGEDLTACAHAYGEWQIGKEATCTSIGFSVRVCTLCGDEDHEFIREKGHLSTEYTYTEEHHFSYCDACGVSIRGAHDLQNHICSVCDHSSFSKGLAFTLNEDGASYSLSGIGDCTDTDIIVPYSHNDFPVTGIAEKAFYANNTLTSIELCAPLDYVGRLTFSYCKSLESIKLPSSLTTVGDYAFSGCIALKSIELPASVTTLGTEVFTECSKSLESIIVEEGNGAYFSEGNCLIEAATGTLILGCKNSVIPSDGSVTAIGEYAFRACAELTSIEIPASVTSIANHAFLSCTSLASVTFAEDGQVASIGVGAFSGCTSLKSIKIPSLVTELNADVLANCTALESVELSSSVTSFDQSAFNWSRALTTVNFNGTMEQWNAISKGGWNFTLGSLTIHCTDGDLDKDGNQI